MVRGRVFCFLTLFLIGDNLFDRGNASLKGGGRLEKKTVSLQKVTQPIETKIIRIVKKRCPIDHYRECDFNFNRCLGCEYKVEAADSCGWYEYPTTVIEERSEREDDEFGADIPTAYYKTIQCANCGSKITFYSSYSTFVLGDNSECPKCGLRHTFLRSVKTKDGYTEVFAIPIKEWEQRRPVA
jgi:predicted RNA-binding Zn-ribbon protein involved in translation (DUF1610 family)